MPKCCTDCDSRYHCNSAMYTDGCLYFPPQVEKRQGLVKTILAFLHLA